MLKRIGKKDVIINARKLTKKVSYPSQVRENYGLFLTLFRMRIFGAAHGWRGGGAGGAKRTPFS